MFSDVTIQRHRHGKAKVRVAKVTRDEDGRQDILEFCVGVELEGGTDLSLTEGDNSGVVATDTCRNHVYLHAKAEDISNCEIFAIGLSQRFLGLYTHVFRVRVWIRQVPWKRVSFGNVPHNHGFVNVAHAICKCRLVADRKVCSLESGLER